MVFGVLAGRPDGPFKQNFTDTCDNFFLKMQEQTQSGRVSQGASSTHKRGKYPTLDVGWFWGPGLPVDDVSLKKISPGAKKLLDELPVRELGSVVTAFAEGQASFVCYFKRG